MTRIVVLEACMMLSAVVPVLSVPLTIAIRNVEKQHKCLGPLPRITTRLDTVIKVRHVSANQSIVCHVAAKNCGEMPAYWTSASEA